MQEKVKNALGATSTRHYATKEEQRLVVEDWKKSGLSMSEYCREHKLTLRNLSNWKRSILGDTIKFKSVSTVPLVNNSATTPQTMIEILVDQRIKIRVQVQQVSDASIIIDIIKGLMTCS